MDGLIDRIPDQVVVVYDEVYYHYVDRPDYPRALDYIIKGKNVIGLHSFSKAYGLAGIRLGYAFSTLEIAVYLNKLKRPFMINTLTMAAGIAALTDDGYISRTRMLIAREKQWLYLELGKAGIDYVGSQANFIFFKAPIEDKLFAAQMLEHGVMVRTCEPFLAPGFIRVTIGTREANEAFIDGLKLIQAKHERPSFHLRFN
jgi:histidinol-phosphate aminotransferase